MGWAEREGLDRTGKVQNPGALDMLLREDYSGARPREREASSPMAREAGGGGVRQSPMALAVNRPAPGGGLGSIIGPSVASGIVAVRPAHRGIDTAFHAVPPSVDLALCVPWAVTSSPLPGQAAQQGRT